MKTLTSAEYLEILFRLSRLQHVLEDWVCWAGPESRAYRHFRIMEQHVVAVAEGLSEEAPVRE